VWFWAKVIWQKATSLDSHFWRKGGRRGHWWYDSKERWWFPIGSLLWPLRCLYNRSVTICHRMWPKLKSTEGGSSWVKIWEWIDRYKPNFNTIWERHGAVVSKRNRVDIFCRLSTMHKLKDRQRNRPHNGNIDRNKRNRLTATSSKKQRSSWLGTKSNENLHTYILVKSI